MRRKILASFILLVLIFTNYVYGVDLNYIRNGGSRINANQLATVLDDNNPLYLDEKFSAETKAITYENIEIFDENDTKIPINISGANFEISGEYLFYIIKLNPDSKYTKKKTLKIKNGISYGGKLYNVKMVINQIRLDGGTKNDTIQPYFRVRVGRVSGSNNNATLNKDTFYPLIYMNPTSNGKAEVDIDYSIFEEENGTEKRVTVNGMLELIDIDLSQGIAVENFVVNKDNTFIKPNTNGNVRVSINAGTSYIYTLKNDNILATDEEKCDVYLKEENFRGTRFTFTWDGQSAGSHLSFTRSIYKNYHKITTKVINGKISEDITKITDHENRDVTYSPNNPETQYLKSLKVDNKTVSVNTYPQVYTFSNITDSHTIEAEYADKYKVTFDSNGGTEINPNIQYVIPNDKATKPTNPTRKGYTFKRWLIKNTSTGFDFDAKVTQNVDLIADWTPTGYKINYVLNGGTNNTNNPTTYTTDKGVNSFISATRPGYKFEGWYKDANYTNNISSIPIGSTGDVTLYAKWTPIEYNVNYVLNGGTNDSSNPKKYTSDVGVNSFKSPNRGGYTFEGWYKDANFTTKITSIPTGTTGDITLYAKWTPVEYKINYVLNGGTNNQTNPTTYTSTEGVNSFKAPTRNGYEFIGWYKDANFTTKITSIPTGSTGDVTLYSKWNQIKNDAPEETTAKYTIEHYKQTADGKYEIAYSKDLEGTIGSTVTCPATTYAGYVENENHSDRKTSGTVNKEGTLVLKRYYDIEKLPVKTAKYTIEYYQKNSKGEYALVDKNTKTGDVGTTVNADEKKYDGYVENKEYKDRVSSGIIKEDESLVLKLYYDKINYNVTFDPQNDTTIPNQTVPYAEKATKPEDPQKDGYTFRYWYYLNENKEPIVYDFNTPVSKNIDLIARWEENKKEEKDNNQQTDNTDTTTKPTTKSDETIAQKILPKTGLGKTIMIGFIIIIIGAIFGIRYFKLKEIIK